MAKEVGQVFGGIGDAVSGVLKGVGDAVDGAVKGVGTLAKQIWDSDVGKAIIIAGAIYFGGAALAGGFGSSMSGGSFLSGMGAGIQSAAGAMADAWTSSSWGPLSEAWSTAADAGATFPGAVPPGIPLIEPAVEANTAALSQGQVAAMDAGGESVGTTFSGGGGAAPTATVAAPPPPPVGAAPGASTVTNYSLGNASVPQITQAGASLPPVDQPWYSKALDYVTPKSELAKYGLISGATQLVGGLIQGAGQDQAAREQREYEAEQLRKAQDLRNANVGADLFAPGQYAAPTPAPIQPTGLARRYMPSYTPMYGQLPPGYGAVRPVMG